MRRQRTYLRLTLLISVLLGILIILALEVKYSTLIALSLCSLAFLYIVIRWVSFLVKSRLKIKVIHHENPTIVRFELQDSGKKE
jgi:hypothetical protein